MNGTGKKASVSARVLYLRTFKDAYSDHTLIINLALIISGTGKLVILGSQNDEMALRSQWRKRFGDVQVFDDYIEYMQSDDNRWRRIVHQEISKADCILLYMEAKNRRFPKLRLLKIRQVEDYHMGPFLRQSTGSGLLYEIAYLDRLKKVKRTIILCRARNASHVMRFIYEAELVLSTGGNGLVFGPRRPETKLFPGARRSRNMLPHFTALDMQVGSLSAAAAVVAFRRNELKRPRSQPSLDLKSVLNRICSKPRTRPGIGLGASAILLGRSDKPRRLPPDGARKIIQFTNVEDLVRIPPREITEVSCDDASDLLGEEVLARGCPYCSQPVISIFFYIYGLYRRPDDDSILGRCQYCFGFLAIRDGMLIAIRVT